MASGRDDAFDVGRLLAKVSALEHKVNAIEVDQQRQNETLQTLVAEQTLQGVILKRVDEHAQEWAKLSKIKRTVSGLVVGSILAILGAAGYSIEQRVRFEGVRSDVIELKAVLSRRPQDRYSIPNVMNEIKSDVQVLSRDSRAWQNAQTTRIDDLDRRTDTLEAPPVKRRRRAVSP